MIGNEQRSAGPAATVHGDSPNPGPLAPVGPRALEVAGLDQRPGLGREDQAGVLPLVTSPPSVSLLLILSLAEDSRAEAHHWKRVLGRGRLRRPVQQLPAHELQLEPYGQLSVLEVHGGGPDLAQDFTQAQTEHQHQDVRRVHRIAVTLSRLQEPASLRAEWASLQHQQCNSTF
nr:hypothetical protein [Allokutzneria albata]